MADYAYHYEHLKVRIYPSQQQKEMIRRNRGCGTLRLTMNMSL